MSCTGVLTKWTKRGFGFITRDTIGDEIFVHQSEILTETDTPPDVGALVQFDVNEDKNGKMKATNVTAKGGAKLGAVTGGRVAGLGRSAYAVHKGGATRGKVKKWFEGKGSLPGGYGFVVPTVGEHAGTDIYIHHSSFGGGSLNIGWDINFDIEEDPSKPGRLRARNAGGPAVCGRGCRAQNPFKTMFAPYEARKDVTMAETAPAAGTTEAPAPTDAPAEPAQPQAEAAPQQQEQQQQPQQEEKAPSPFEVAPNASGGSVET